MAEDVTIRNPSTGEERVVGAAAVPFFTSQGFQPIDAAEPAGRHEQPEPATPADPADPGADTTTTTTSKEN